MNDWKTATLGDLVEPAETWNPANAAPNKIFDYIDLNAVDQDAKLIRRAHKIPCDEAPSRARQLVAKGDVLVSTVRPNLNGVAKVPEELDGATASTGFCILRARSTVLDRSYLFHWVKSPAFIGEMVRKATGASYPAVSHRIIFESRLPLPPLEEQRRIADVLDRAEALRAKRRVALAQVDSLTQSIFLDLFGDPLANNSNHKHVKFGSVARRITYGFTSPMKHLDDGIPIITAKNVQDGFIDFESVHYANQSEFDALTAKSKPESGDVLITKDGTIGRCAMVETSTPFCINQSVALVQPVLDQVRPSYMVAYLSTNGVQNVMKNMGKGNALAHLQITELAEVTMPLPPISLQDDFARCCAGVTKLKVTHQRSLAGLDRLFSVLQHRAFRGEL